MNTGAMFLSQLVLNLNSCFKENKDENNVDKIEYTITKQYRT